VNTRLIDDKQATPKI